MKEAQVKNRHEEKSNRSIQMFWTALTEEQSQFVIVTQICTIDFDLIYILSIKQFFTNSQASCGS